MNKLFFFVLIFVHTAFAETDLSKVKFIFLDMAESSVFLSQKDEYTNILSPLDLSLYHSTSRTISLEEHLDFLKTTTLNWTESEKKSIEEKVLLYKRVATVLKLNLKYPNEIVFIKTNGEDAFNSHYTRGNGIIFPAGKNGTIETDLGTFYHEMFHIVGRENPALKEELFSLIGFYPVKRVELPESLALVRTTNPDAFYYEHAVSIKHNDVDHLVIPFMYSAIKKEDINGPVEESKVYKLALLDINSLVTDPKMFKVSETNYKDIVKANTHYYIHPEEIIAEDFKLLLLQNTDEIPVPTIKFQDVLDQIKGKLQL